MRIAIRGRCGVSSLKSHVLVAKAPYSELSNHLLPCTLLNINPMLPIESLQYQLPFVEGCTCEEKEKDMEMRGKDNYAVKEMEKADAKVAKQEERISSLCYNLVSVL